MRIERLFIPEHIANTTGKGLKELNLPKLGTVIALIGVNGAGKTRILDLIENHFIKNINVGKLLDGSISNIPTEYKNVVNVAPEDLKQAIILSYELSELDQIVSKNENNKIAVNTRLHKASQFNSFHAQHQVRTQYSTLKQQFTTLDKGMGTVFSKYVRRIKYDEVIKLQTILNSNTKNSPTSFDSLLEKLPDSNGTYNEFEAINQSAFAYLKSLPHKLTAELIDCLGDMEKFHNSITFKRYDSLKGFVFGFLKKNLTWERSTSSSTVSDNAEEVVTKSTGIWKLDGEPFNYNDLSPGQRTLFTYCLLFFLLDQNPQVNIKESILLIDEPELHLHPESEIDLIKSIKGVIGEKGQLWIATHSLSILANLSYDEIFMVKGGTIIHPQKTTPEDCFVQLMGIGHQVEKLSHFVSNISIWAYMNFITQCFDNPDVIESAKANDPEVELFKKSLKLKENGTILLDFGAGKGRVFKELKNDLNLNNKLNYSALEINNENTHELLTLGIKTVYNSHNELPKKFFDYVLLCGVLHEVPIIEWEENLNKIKDSLKDDGFIILIEDLMLPKGEKIEKEGFLILDSTSVQTLFSMREEPSLLKSDMPRYKDRMLCALIHKEKMGVIDNNSIINALIKLRDNIKIKEWELRGEIPTPENRHELGRKSAFYSQLYLNTVFAEETLNKVLKKQHA